MRTYEDIEIGDLVRVIHIDKYYWVRITDINENAFGGWEGIANYINEHAVVHKTNFVEFFDMDALCSI